MKRVLSAESRPNRFPRPGNDVVLISPPTPPHPHTPSWFLERTTRSKGIAASVASTDIPYMWQDTQACTHINKCGTHALAHASMLMHHTHVHKHTHLHTLQSFSKAGFQHFATQLPVEKT